MVGPMAESPSFNPCAYQPPVSLWKLVELYSPEHERQEIREVLGESLVEQSLELHGEIDTLLEIWRDFRCETYAESYQKRLPEPPAVRDRLKQEIQFFVENIRERASRQGVDPEKIFASHNKDVLDYALEKAGKPSTPSRPSTMMTSAGRETPMLTSPSSDRMSLASTVSEEVEAMNDKLNILEIDEVIHHLRATLEDEIAQLFSDISFLQGCLDDEANFRDESTSGVSSEPSLSELQKERASLEKDMLKTDLPLPSPAECVSKPAVSAQLRKYAPLTPTKACRNETDVVSSNGNRTSPMKACHQLSSPEKRKTEKSARSRANDMASGENHVQRDTNSAYRIRVATASSRAQVVQISAVAGADYGAKTGGIIPSPPASTRPKVPRPSSADRFRKMVIQNRDGIV